MYKLKLSNNSLYIAGSLLECMRVFSARTVKKVVRSVVYMGTGEGRVGHNDQSGTGNSTERRLFNGKENRKCQGRKGWIGKKDKGKERPRMGKGIVQYVQSAAEIHPTYLSLIQVHLEWKETIGRNSTNFMGKRLQILICFFKYVMIKFSIFSEKLCLTCKIFVCSMLHATFVL